MDKTCRQLLTLLIFMTFPVLKQAVARNVDPDAITLEWNSSWRTDVPYEISFNAEKLSGKDWVIENEDGILP